MTSAAAPQEPKHSHRQQDRFFVDLYEPLADEETVDRAFKDMSAVVDNVHEAIATRRHAAYYLAQVHEYRGEIDRMVELLGYSGTRIGRDQDGYDFLAHQGWAHVFLEDQAKAIARGIPPIMISSLPHSGSSFLSALVTRVLDIQCCRTTKGPYFAARIVPAWLWTFAQGGATTHEHFAASYAHIGLLESVGIKAINVHVRHPMAVLISAYRIFQEKPPTDHELAYYLRRLGVDARPDEVRDPVHGLKVFARMFMPSINEFLSSWASFSAHGTGLLILVSRYEDLMLDPAAHGKSILQHFDVEPGAIAEVAAQLRVEASGGAHNFKGRDSNRQIADIDGPTLRAIRSHLTPGLLEFYGYA